MTSKHRAPDAIIRTLEAAVERLSRLTDPADDRCGVAAEHKEAVEPYVSTWILPNVEGALGWARGEMNADGKDYLGDMNP